MSNEEFARWIEPLLHVVSVLSGLITASLMTSSGSYHPSPLSTSWCGVDKYPYWCTAGGGDCDGDVTQTAPYVLAYLISITSVCILVSSMILIVTAVRGQQLRMNNKNSLVASRGTEARDLEREAHILAKTKIVMKQAIAYTLINMFGFVMIVGLPWIRNYNEGQVPSMTFQVFFLIFRPLQGLLNSIIFICHKAFAFQRAHPTKFYTALGKVLKGEEDEGDDRVISDLLILKKHSALGRVRFAFDDNSYESSAPPTELPPTGLPPDGLPPNGLYKPERDLRLTLLKKHSALGRVRFAFDDNSYESSAPPIELPPTGLPPDGLPPNGLYKPEEKFSSDLILDDSLHDDEFLEMPSQAPQYAHSTSTSISRNGASIADVSGAESSAQNTLSGFSFADETTRSGSRASASGSFKSSLFAVSVAESVTSIVSGVFLSSNEHPSNA
eukprot:CAMPEP_0194096112 /NCGR_PEP_ID=MMETSP0149-20130528/57174_1 /TAXON_ID=122233 /ORGANISM="Chaetoceros debilis, Strain MM31A-1" /LENGTH=441 /DNA_ID=CAMNT_0038782079 /DNA_START=699 /DNA_END=2025 /DNA_ORIENTATION=-